MERLDALYVLGAEACQATYGPQEQQRIAALVNILAPPQTPESALALPPDLLARVQLLISGWGGPTLDAAWLARTPQLRALFYGAGSVSPVMTVAAWRRGLVVTSASEANARPVAEYTLAMIILCLKHAWRLARDMRAAHASPGRDEIPGAFERVVGLVSLGAVGRAVAALLTPFDVSILAYDPRGTTSQTEAAGVTLVSLDDLFRTSDVVSVHAPHLPATERMITGAHLSLMKRGASFINTSRGAVICEDDLIAVAARRPDLQIVLDVTEPMPPDPASLLYTLPNVLLTPHLAGSQGHECRRMGRWIVDEIERYVRGAPLRSAVTLDAALTSAHRPVSVDHELPCPSN